MSPPCTSELRASASHKTTPRPTAIHNGHSKSGLAKAASPLTIPPPVAGASIVQTRCATITPSTCVMASDGGHDEQGHHHGSNSQGASMICPMSAPAGTEEACSDL